MPAPLLALLCLLFLPACDGGEPVETGGGGNGNVNGETGDTQAEADADGDGFGVSEDCDDADAAINPDAADGCDGIDNNCDGATDEAGPSWYPDLDGFGYPAGATAACTAPNGYIADASDCDDTRASTPTMLTVTVPTKPVAGGRWSRATSSPAVSTATSSHRAGGARRARSHRRCRCTSWRPAKTPPAVSTTPTPSGVGEAARGRPPRAPTPP